MKNTKCIIAVLALLVASIPILRAEPKAGFGKLYYENTIVRTVVPPAAMKKAGTDDLYAVMGGVSDQLPVIAVAPGDRDYRGGKWAFHAVTWNVEPYLLTSEAEVLAAGALGDVSISRVAEMDFKCPVQP